MKFPVLAILGPGQSGKTILSQNIFPDYQYVSFEDYDIHEFAENDPGGFLNRCSEKEIDLIIDRGVEKNGIEIKSGGTINEKYFDGLK